MRATSFLSRRTRTVVFEWVGSVHNPGHAKPGASKAAEGGVRVFHQYFAARDSDIRFFVSGLTAYNHNLDTSREFYPSVRLACAPLTLKLRWSTGHFNSIIRRTVRDDLSCT